MAAHVACRPDVFDGHPDTGCFVVCARHDLRIPFGSSYAVALAACREHNARHHVEPERSTPRLLSIVYRSVQTGDLDLADLLRQARGANRSAGITGMLLAQDGRFLQALEGPEPAVRSLLASIRRDPRHREVTVLVEEVVVARRFPDWAMGTGDLGGIEALPLADYYEGMLIARGAAA
ncbi:BLUF domain-containing protein [Amnibacterium kyonggiense]